MYLLLNVILQGLTYTYLYMFRNIIDFQWKFITIIISFVQFLIYFIVFLKNPGMATFSGLRAPENISYAQKRYFFVGFFAYFIVGNIIVDIVG